MHVNRRSSALHSANDVEVGATRKVGVNPSLQADLRRADGPGFGDATLDFLNRECEGVVIGATLRKCAEATSGVTDVREIDIAIDHVGDVIAIGLVSQRIGEGRQSRERFSITCHQGECLLITDTGGVRLGGAQCSGDLRIDAGCRGRTHTNAQRVSAHRIPVAKGRVEVRSCLGEPARRVNVGTEIDSAGRHPFGIGFLPRASHRCGPRSG